MPRDTMPGDRLSVRVTAAATGTAAPDETSPWVRRWLGAAATGTPPQGLDVLDFAAGRGRHARLACGLGHRVCAADRDAAALEALAELPIERIVCDLERTPWPFQSRRFDVVLCCNYLDRERWEAMAALLAPGGWLVHETFAAGNARLGRPSNPHFLLRPDELLQRSAAAALQVVAFEQGRQELPHPAVVQRLCARRVGPFDEADAPLG